MTIQEAIKDLRNDDSSERVAEDLATKTLIFPAMHRQLFSADAILSTRWITRDAR